MQIRLHNKYEINLRGKTYTAYNTLLKSVYSKIGKLEQYTSHIAIGTGLTNLNYTDSKLNNYLMSFQTETEEIQSDISKGVLYIKKVVNIDENNTSSFSFSELGITDTNEFDPIVYNHVLLTDSLGDPVSITRNVGDPMQIKVTIYLELSANAFGLFTTGKNYLIEQILGENLNIEDNNLYVTRGENLLENKYISRTTPTLTDAVIAKTDVIFDDDNLTASINFVAELGEGATEEIIICYNNQACLRLNTLELKQPLSTTIELTPLNGNNIDIGNHVKSIISVYKKEASENILENHLNIVKYSKKLTEKINNVFDLPFNSNTPRFVSSDGNLIAFIYDSYVHIYKYSDYGFIKLKTSQVPANNISKIILFENKFIIIQTTAPYINIFHIDNNIAIKQNLNMQVYDDSIYPYNWLNVEAILTEDNRFKLGVIVNDNNNSALVITLTMGAGNTYYDSIQKPILTTAKHVFSINKTSFNESVIGFITDTYDGETNYLMEEFYSDSSSLRDASDVPFTLLNDTQGIQTGGRMIISQKSTYPYLKAYYYPTLVSASDNFSSGKQHYLSYNGDYLITKFEDGSFKIYNSHIVDSLIEFDNNLPAYINQTEVTDFEFVGDLLLVFTSNTNEPVFASAFKLDNTRIENLSNALGTYIINYEKYDLLGNKPLEGVKIKLNLLFGGNSTTPTSINMNEE